MPKTGGKKRELSYFSFFIFIFADAVLQNGEENRSKWMKVSSSFFHAM